MCGNNFPHMPNCSVVKKINKIHLKLTAQLITTNINTFGFVDKMINEAKTSFSLNH